MNASMAGKPLAPSIASDGARAGVRVAAGSADCAAASRDRRARSARLSRARRAADSRSGRRRTRRSPPSPGTRARGARGRDRPRARAAPGRRMPAPVHAGGRVEHDALGPRLVRAACRGSRPRRGATAARARGRGATRRRVPRARAPASRAAPAGSAPWMARRRARSSFITNAAPMACAKRECSAPGNASDVTPELPHAPQALHLGRVHEPLDDVLLVRLEGDEAVHRVAQDHRRARHADASARHCPSSYQTRRRRAATGARRATRRRSAGRASRTGRPLRVPRDAERLPASSAASDGPRQRLARLCERHARGRARRARPARAAAGPRRRPRRAARLHGRAAPRREGAARAPSRWPVGDASPSTKRRPSACALSPVVPLPANTSTTRPTRRRRARDDAVEQRARLLRREPVRSPVRA